MHEPCVGSIIVLSVSLFQKRCSALFQGYMPVTSGYGLFLLTVISYEWKRQFMPVGPVSEERRVARLFRLKNESETSRPSLQDRQ